MIKSVCEIATEASHAILTIYRKGDFDVNRKSDNSPITKADLAANRIIADGLKQLTPDVPQLSEEGKSIPYSTRQNWGRYWLIDPLDGTRDFIAQTDSFSVNIALIENQQSILGVIHLPVSNECFFAAHQYGAYKTQDDQAPTPIHTRLMKDHTPVIAVSGFREDSVLSRCLTQLPDYQLQHMGSSIKSCRVAEGKVDWYPCLGPTSEWDTAAAQCIVEQAGGSITRLDGQRLRYNTKESLRNPWFMVCGDPNFDWHQLVPSDCEQSVS